ncbi:MAG TPA: glycoside hydrolase family 28 protein [Verrucomicrobiae bacterium]|nr:glycoside hydrolase family 28 protein [Verrucomicrobiae bacterium]
MTKENTNRMKAGMIARMLGLGPGLLAPLLIAVVGLAADSPPSTASANESGVFNVKTFGATANGTTLDTDAINKAILAANAAGGGTVRFPAGTYLSTSIHLKSNVTLLLDQGSVIEAASETLAPYDPREPGTSTRYQDSGHSYWHDALIWGDRIENVSILGPGLIHGKGLRNGLEGKIYRDTPPGSGNKAISLVNCHNVTLRDFSVRHGGWFAILATGVDNLTIDNVKLDTNRDGMDIDCCRNVRISNCSVNSPWDDGICLKSSYALGFARATENVTINNCFVTGGLIEGTLIDGTFKRSPSGYASGTGRIKFGTESNGGFKNITIANCVFEDCGGLAIESVDGGAIEDVAISNIAMRGINNSPIFIRLGSRLRGPNNPPVGVIRRVNISNIVVSGADLKLCSIISGIPGHSVEEVSINNVQILHNGGGTAKQAGLQPAEKEAAYPEPGMFGAMPAYGFFVRHATEVDFTNVRLDTEQEDLRPAVSLEDVKGANFLNVNWRHVPQAPSIVLKNVEKFNVRDCPVLPDTRLERAEKQQF